MRWVLAVTAAETIGYLAPSIASLAAFRIDLPPAALPMIVAGAAFVEGAALGAGQAYALPFRVRRLRFVLLTGAAAVLVSAGVLAALLLPLVLVPLAAAVRGAAIGSAQWLELRHQGSRAYPGAYRWIGWTTLAWTVALPLGLAPGLLVMVDIGLQGPRAPFVAHLALCSAGGPLMGALVAVITWRAVKLP